MCSTIQSTLQSDMQSAIQPPLLIVYLIGLLVMLTGCSTTNQIHSTTQVRAIHLDAVALKTSGIAFITPTSVTGQEEDKQALAMAFSETLRLARPDLKILPLPETLGAINSASLAGEYKKMLDDAHLSEIFNRDTLQKISRVTGVHYFAQLKLGGFRQGLQERWGFLGIRLIETQTTSLRIYLQILDSESGMIAWEGSQELTASIDTLKDSPIAFKDAVEQSAKELISRLP